MQERLSDADLVKDCGCGLTFKRKGVRTLLDRTMRGEKRRLVVAHKDRPARIGFERIRHVIASAVGATVVRDNVPSSPVRERVENLVAIVHVFSCRPKERGNHKSKSKPGLSD